METTFEHQFDETKIKQRFKRVYYALFAPVYVRFLLYIVFFAICGVLYSGLKFTFIALDIVYAIIILTWFPKTWRMYHELFKKTGAMENSTIIHLTDTSIEISCGNNKTQNEYKVFSSYLALSDTIALINQRTITAIFERNDFDDNGEKFIQCLDNAGVKNLHMWSFKRWWAISLPIIMAILLCLVYCTPLVTIKARENAYRAMCNSNLKQLTTGLVIYSIQLKEEGIDSLPENFPHNVFLDFEYVNDENVFYCPKTGTEYMYIPYNRLLDGSSSTAKYTPILFDYISGSHILDKHTRQTLVAFEDGHVYAENDISCPKDIYEKYAPLMEKGDAEILRIYCDEF